VGKGIVDAVECAKGGKKLRVVLGVGFKRMESAKLRNPDRLVLLFRGEGQRVAPPPPEPVSAPEPTPPPATPPVAATAPSAPAEAPKKTAAFDVVVIDPGHGGPDTGANTADGLQEKFLTLAIAQKAEALLEKEGLRVVLTRSTDLQVPLIQRTAIANYNRADLFLSIHLNASPAPSARGTETYYLSRDATDLWATQLAAKENSAGQDAAAAPDGGLNLVLWELAQTSVIVESAALAEAVQQEFNTLLGTADRGVRQAPFVVLEGAQMPAILVEVAFLSNGEEAKRLTDPAFQDQVAAALVKSILSFKARYERPQTPPPAP
jgi:N-acetylmuramoyl-L-alanine amidase